MDYKDAKNEILNTSAMPQVESTANGYNSNDPEMVDTFTRLRPDKFTGKEKFRAGIQGLAQGMRVGETTMNPLSAFIQGAATGLQIPSEIYNEKVKQIQSAWEAAPFGSTHPEIVKQGEGYALLSGLPTKIALDVIKQISLDAAKISAEGKEKEKQIYLAKDLETIKDSQEAESYSTMTNRALGLEGENAIQPYEIIGMRKQDVDNFIRTKSSSGPNFYEEQSTELMEKAPGNLASQFGIPSERKNPYYKMPPKVYEKVKVANSVLANKTIEKMNDKSMEFNNVINSLKRAIDLLNGGLQTGPIAGRIPGRKLGADAQEFDQIASTVLPAMRQGMPGAVSDRDMAIFKQANFALNKDERINRRVINQSMAIATRTQDKAEFMSNWATAYNDLTGAETAWSKYIKENPLFTAKGDINPNIETFQEYFNKKSANSVLWDSEKEARYQELKSKMGVK